MENAGEMLSWPRIAPIRLDMAYGDQLMKKASVMTITTRRVLFLAFSCLIRVRSFVASRIEVFLIYLI